MVRRKSLVVERLEQRAVLSSLAYSLTTDQSVYQLGQPIEMTFTETNTSDQPVTVPALQSAGFSITHNGTLVSVDALPSIVVTGTYTFQPEQTLTFPETWDGIPLGGPYTMANLTGNFVVGYGPGGDSNEFTTTFQIVAPSPDDLATNVATDQSTYEAGQAVNLTFTETNDGDAPVAVVTGAPEFEITQNGATVWSPFFAGAPITPITTQPAWSTLQPGQTYSQTAEWNGLPESGASSSLAAPFTVSNDFDPNAGTATFQYVAPPSSDLTTSLTTDQSIYQLGQEIQLTFTETNIGTTPVQVLDGTSSMTSLPSFNITQNGNLVWSSLYPNPGNLSAPSDIWLTLQPGQSFTQRAWWNGVPDQLPSADSSGTFTVSNELDPDADTATFQILSTPYSAPSSPNPEPPSSITSPLPVMATLVTPHDAYVEGHSVHMSVVLTNSTANKIAVAHSQNVETVTIRQGSTLVFESTRKVRARAAEIIKPDHALKVTAFWSGKPNQAGVKKPMLGRYTITVDYDGYAASASIQLERAQRR